MPAITIQSIELAESQKKVIAKEFVRIFSELTNVPQDRVYIFFDGYQLNEVGTGGMLFSDKPPQRAMGKFNEENWGKIQAPNSSEGR
jgi:4-oxalocrotonate tautomerase